MFFKSVDLMFNSTKTYVKLSLKKRMLFRVHWHSQLFSVSTSTLVNWTGNEPEHCHVIIHTPSIRSIQLLWSMAWFWLQLTHAPSDNGWACFRVSTCQECEQQQVWIWTLWFMGIRKTSCKDTDCIMIKNVPDLFYLRRYRKWEEREDLLLEMSL